MINTYRILQWNPGLELSPLLKLSTYTNVWIMYYYKRSSWHKILTLKNIPMGRVHFNIDMSYKLRKPRSVILFIHNYCAYIIKMWWTKHAWQELYNPVFFLIDNLPESKLLTFQNHLPIKVYSIRVCIMYIKKCQFPLWNQICNAT